MSRKFYNKNLTFLQDQPFAETILTGLYYKKKRAKLSLTRDPSFPTQMLSNAAKQSLASQPSVGTQPLPLMGASFCSTRARNKSERMRKAETSLVKHFCLILERVHVLRFAEQGAVQDRLYQHESEQDLYCSAPALFAKRTLGADLGFKVAAKQSLTSAVPHLLVSVDSMQDILLATRGSRSVDRIKTPSQFKKILRECRKIRLLYGNLSMRHLYRATSKMRLPGENLLIWLESRLDVVLERCGFFGSVKAARQSVLNGKILVNSKVVKSPSFILKGGDFIKVIQEKLLFDSLDKQLSRGVLFSYEVFPSFLRNKTAPSVRLVSKAGVKPCKQSFPPCKSFYTWLQKKEENFRSSENLGRQSKALLSTDLQFKNFPGQNSINLDEKFLSPKNWRFLGSPHLLFSLLFLHAHLQRVMSFISQTCNKNLLVDKKVVKQEGVAEQPDCTCSASKARRVFASRTRPAWSKKLCGTNRLKNWNNTRTLTEVYSNFFTLPWFIRLKKEECFSRDQEFSQLVSILVIKNEERSSLCVLFSDLLLYSLLKKKEVVSVHLQKERLESDNQKVSRVLPVSTSFSRKRKISDYRVAPTVALPVGLSRVPDDNSRFSKMDNTRFKLSDKFYNSQARRIKPLHLEVSYQSLCAVFLFPPQRICLPAMVDVDCLAKAF